MTDVIPQALIDRALAQEREARWVVTNFAAELYVERQRQEQKFPDQHLPNGTGGPDRAKVAYNAKLITNKEASHDRLTWLHVLQEEVAEAFAESDPRLLRAELVQVAAVALRWIEDIDRA